MEKESIREKIKLETELIKIYSIFVIAISTGISGLILRWKFYINPAEAWLGLIGGVFFIIFAIAFINSFFRIMKLAKKI